MKKRGQRAKSIRVTKREIKIIIRVKYKFDEGGCACLNVHLMLFQVTCKRIHLWLTQNTLEIHLK